ncbi:septum formation initiator family protein [Arthrobacter sp. ISL-48]|uniref:FtsB family cell division protein n=1 Tax=Arthrobacter sp. ISL-48 TaxID=2819110 RepID=UPI001BE5CC43|nr:septum formation initiator family protein [Arthrobacter sp. ISL-48]MBT2530845.1 septum formation initiator family protein [Arthrobacter sp. ISL-48]
MATRRPKVPRATPRQEATAKPALDSADVIRPDFGGGRENLSKENAARQNSAQDKAAQDKAARDKAARDRAGSGRASTQKAVPAGQSRDAQAEEMAHPVPAKAFSGRMLALAVVMIAITIMLAPTVKIFFDKKAEIDALNADIAASQAQQDGLRQQISRWQDPNYVKQQARDRINMVMPGETGYWVFGGDLPAGTTSSQTGAAAQDPADLPWVDSLWESIRRAATD